MDLICIKIFKIIRMNLFIYLGKYIEIFHEKILVAQFIFLNSTKMGSFSKVIMTCLIV